MATYEISDELTVLIWASEDKDEDPIIVQPAHPDGRAWVNFEDAESWAKDRLGLVPTKPETFEPVSPEEGTDPVLVAEEE